jgi:hypothetical protein
VPFRSPQPRAAVTQAASAAVQADLTCQHDMSEATYKQHMHTYKHVAGAREAPCVCPAGHAVHLQCKSREGVSLGASFDI